MEAQTQTTARASSALLPAPEQEVRGCSRRLTGAILHLRISGLSSQEAQAEARQDTESKTFSVRMEQEDDEGSGRND